MSDADSDMNSVSVAIVKRENILQRLFYILRLKFSKSSCGFKSNLSFR